MNTVTEFIAGLLNLPRVKLSKPCVEKLDEHHAIMTFAIFQEFNPRVLITQRGNQAAAALYNPALPSTETGFYDFMSFEEVIIQALRYTPCRDEMAKVVRQAFMDSPFPINPPLRAFGDPFSLTLSKNDYDASLSISFANIDLYQIDVTALHVDALTLSYLQHALRHLVTVEAGKLSSFDLVMVPKQLPDDTFIVDIKLITDRHRIGKAIDAVLSHSHFTSLSQTDPTEHECFLARFDGKQAKKGGFPRSASPFKFNDDLAKINAAWCKGWDDGPVAPWLPG
jgi:hypothetical protein